MLDKSIPYKHIVMEMNVDSISKLTSNNDADDKGLLPPGFSFGFFRQGMEQDWASIEASVLEFSDESSALDYFYRDYLGPFFDELKRRCIFVIDDSTGQAVATATAWFGLDSDDRSRDNNNITTDNADGIPSSKPSRFQPSLHWVGVLPEYQGKGLGKAVTVKACQVLNIIHPNRPILLHTQTWSHRAVVIYWKLGFRISKTKRVHLLEKGGNSVNILGNDYPECLDSLRTVLSADTVQRLAETAA